jgi:hypothetical protein
VADASADAPDAFGVSGVRGFARKRPAGFFFADTYTPFDNNVIIVSNERVSSPSNAFQRGSGSDL